MNDIAELKEELAYEEMTLAAATIISKIKEFPNLLDQLVKEVEVALIKIALDRCGGNRAKAAKMLGLKRTTLVEKCKRFKTELAILDGK